MLRFCVEKQLLKKLKSFENTSKTGLMTQPSPKEYEKTEAALSQVI